MGVRRPELVLAAAILVSLPMVPSFLSGGLSPASALVRFAVAIALCWAATAIVERVYSNYSRQVRQAELRRVVEEARQRFESPQGNEAPPEADQAKKK